MSYNLGLPAYLGWWRTVRASLSTEFLTELVHIKGITHDV